MTLNHQRLLWLSMLMGLLACRSALAHQAGIIDSHITVGLTTVKLVYTVPSAQLALLYPQQPDRLSAVANSFKVRNDDQPCKLGNQTTSPLSEIDATQFFMTWRCASKLGNLAITDLNASTPSLTYQNLALFSIAGQYKKVVFDATTSSHQFPIGYLLTLWQKTLVDEEAQPPANANSQLVNMSLANLSQSTDYIPIGIEHILFGWDHVLFLLGLLLLITRIKPLLILVTCFTIAHSVALALSVLNIVNLPASIIEALIALTIVYVAVENIIKLNTTTPQLQHRWLLIIGFGFIHGFGFSFLLKAIGHTDDLLPTLLLFNLGVEIGQLMIVLPLFGLMYTLERRYQHSLGRRHKLVIGKQLISLLTAAMGLYWFLSRSLF